MKEIMEHDYVQWQENEVENEVSSSPMFLSEGL